jgi:hypothetical protein
MENNLTKIIPLEEIYLKDKKIDYTIWAFFQLNSYKTKAGETFVYKTHETTPTAIYRSIRRQCKNNDTGELLCKENGKPKYNISLSTVKNNLKIYKELGLITEGKVMGLDKKEYDCFYLKNKFDLYAIIPQKTLSYLLENPNTNTIKVYAYLKYRFDTKKEKGNFFTFTKKHIALQIGYSDNNNTNKILDNIFNFFKEKELIHYEEYFKINSNGKPTPEKKLIKIDTIKSEIPTTPNQFLF